MKTVSRKLVERKPGYEVWEETSLLEFDAVVINAAGDPEGAQEMVDEMNDASGRLNTMEVCYAPDGGYIGTPKIAAMLCDKRGIAPETVNGHKVCSIGFCEREQKWYGWSHRAIYGFGVGDKVEPGDCAYVPFDKEVFRKDCLRFWESEEHDDTWAVEERGPNGEAGVLTSWRYAKHVKNKKLAGKINGIFTPYPDAFGRGAWTAESLEDARQMAIDFANGVG